MRVALREFMQQVQNGKNVRNIQIPLTFDNSDCWQSGSPRSVDKVCQQPWEGDQDYFHDMGSGSKFGEISLYVKRVRNCVIEERAVLEVDFQLSITFASRKKHTDFPLQASGNCRIDRKTGAIVSMHLT